MPSTMIHFMVAHELEPDAPGLYWVGNNAPDYAGSRELKDHIHYRDSRCRQEDIISLLLSPDYRNDFERGWAVHLFTDFCWDGDLLPKCEKYFSSKNPDEHWFHQYRREIWDASSYLYHNLPWANEIFLLIENTDLTGLVTDIAVSLSEIERYRAYYLASHRAGEPDRIPEILSIDIISAFVSQTVRRYKAYME